MVFLWLGLVQYDITVPPALLLKRIKIVGFSSILFVPVSIVVTPLFHHSPALVLFFLAQATIEAGWRKCYPLGREKYKDCLI